MRKLPAVIFLTCIINFFALAQTIEHPSCPKIGVTGPSSEIMSGEDAVFTVAVSGADENKLEYHWSVSAGTIKSGLGTPVIRVYLPTDSYGEIKATVEIKGFAEHCANSGGATASLACGSYITEDEYEKLSWIQEKQRLDSAVAESKKINNEGIVLILSFPKKTSIAARKARILNIESYLVKIHKMSKENIKVVAIDDKVLKTKIYLVSKRCRPLN